MNNNVTLLGIDVGGGLELKNWGTYFSNILGAKYKKLNKHFEYFCCIYPTAPFITAKKLSDSFEILKKTNADAVIHVVKFSYTIQRVLKIKNNKL